MKFKDFIAGLIAFLVIGGIISAMVYGVWSSTYGPGTEDLAKIGEVQSDIKRDGTYVVNYVSTIDQVNSLSESKDKPNLALVKTILNASIDKNFSKIYIERQCFDEFPKLYAGNGYIRCSVYGMYSTAIQVRDKDLYDSIMITYIDGGENYRRSKDSRYKIIPIISRDKNHVTK